MSEKYLYQSLPSLRSIRMLELLPGIFGDDLHIKIQLYDLFEEARRPFDALSYVWGDASNRKSIYCDHKIILVTQNLFTAMQYLRSTEGPRSVWIDAICINQDDIVERSHQIKLMRDIYSLANCVEIWIDEEEDWSSLAFDTLRKWAKLVKSPATIFSKPKNYNTKESGGVEWLDVVNKQGDSVLSLFKKDWFLRSWTFQEVCMSSRAQLICGDLKLPFETVVMAHQTVSQINWIAAFEGVEDVLLIWKALNDVQGGAKRTYSLSDMLFRTRLRDATDPRDKIYSLLGLASESRNFHVSKLDSNYIDSAKEVYTQYAFNMIRDDRGLNVFSCLEGKSSNSTLPTWVPDWTIGHPTYPLAAPILVGKEQIHRTTHCTNLVDVDLSPDQTTMLLRGVRFDAVSQISSVEAIREMFSSVGLGYDNDELQSQLVEQLFDSDEWQGQLAALVDMAAELKLGDNYLDTEEFSELSLLRTLCADLSPLSDKIEDREKALTFHWHNAENLKKKSLSFGHNMHMRWIKYDDYEWKGQADDITSFYHALIIEEREARKNKASSMYVKLRRSARSLLASQTHLEARLVQEFCYRVDMQTSGRILFTTSKGYVGLGPKAMELGDEVFVLQGGEVPYILRRIGRSDTFSILGEAYVHGIMDGELFDLEDDGITLKPKDESMTWEQIALV